MISLFKDIPEAIENTVVIAKRCSYFVKMRDPILPKYPGLQNISESDHLANISYKGLDQRLELSTTKFSNDEKNNYKIFLELNYIDPSVKDHCNKLYFLLLQIDCI